ncbi:FCD domain-containing protein [Nonomuraea rubra]|uniref:FCD domain-containing protein n=1 Tax=Nonomuraea rubra TaxID=46180 RepID=UPI003612598D
MAARRAAAVGGRAGRPVRRQPHRRARGHLAAAGGGAGRDAARARLVRPGETAGAGLHPLAGHGTHPGRPAAPPGAAARHRGGGRRARRRPPHAGGAGRRGRRAAPYGRGAGGASDAVEADFAFHRAVAAATANRFYLDLLDTLGAGAITRPYAGPEPDPGHLDQVLGEHRRIRDAIASGDAMGAAAAMRTHLDASMTRLRGYER